MDWTETKYLSLRILKFGDTAVYDECVRGHNRDEQAYWHVLDIVSAKQHVKSSKHSTANVEKGRKHRLS